MVKDTQMPSQFEDGQEKYWVRHSPNAPKKQWRRYESRKDFDKKSVRYHAFTDEEAEAVYTQHQKPLGENETRPPIFNLSDEELNDLPDFNDEEPQQQKTGEPEGEQKAEEPTGETDRYIKLLEQRRIRPTDDIPKPAPAIAVEVAGVQYVFGSIGDISTVTGKAKSKKTFVISCAVAAAIGQKIIIERLVGRLPDDKQNVLLFDTEQSSYYVHRVIKRICKLADLPDPPNLFVYPLRQDAPKERLKIIEVALKNTPNVGMLVIDGVRDLGIDPILDNAEANHILTTLLQWSTWYNIYILVVLHQNKADRNLRGVLGTELLNKSETVIEVIRDDADKNVSHVEPKDTRHKEFPAFSFSIDEYGTPQPVEYSPTKKDTIRGEKAGRAKSKPVSVTSRFTEEEHRLIVHRGFQGVEPGKYAATWQRLKRAAEYFGHTLADNPAKELLNFYQDAGYVTKDGQVYILNLSRQTEGEQNTQDNFVEQATSL